MSLEFIEELHDAAEVIFVFGVAIYIHDGSYLDGRGLARFPEEAGNYVVAFAEV